MKNNKLLKKLILILPMTLFILLFCACYNNSEEQNSFESSIVSDISKNEAPSNKNSNVESSIVSDVSKSENPSTSNSNIESSIETSQSFNGNIPEKWLDNGIFSEYYENAYKYLKTMTLDEKIGQMLFARCPSENAVEIAQKYHLGGYVLFGIDFDNKTFDEIKNNILSYKNSQDIPMAIATDEEGGTVVRVSNHPQLYPSKFLSPREIFNNGGMNLIKSEETKKADLLSSLGIDVNFAPVCDISTNTSDFMYQRSLGENATTTAEFISTVTQISQSKGVSVTLKHFPGYGNNVDTHTGIAYDERDYDTFLNNDFIPFKSGIQNNAHIVMVSHNIVKCMDNTKPSSISANVHNILRNELNFTGIIITDDLAMDAIKEYSGEYPPTVTAVLAENDMLTVSDIESSFNEIKQATINGIIPEETIDHAVMRILAWKEYKRHL